MLSVLFSFLLSFSGSIPAHSTDMILYKSYIPAEYGVTLRHIHVDGNKGMYLITGETTLKNGVFFYSVEDGHVEFIHEKQLLVKKRSKWASFKIRIEIPSSKLPHNGSLILNLYERTSRGETVQTYPVILEKFYN